MASPYEGIGENLVQNFHNVTKTPTVSLRYHDFVPKPYVAFGEKEEAFRWLERAIDVIRNLANDAFRIIEFAAVIDECAVVVRGEPAFVVDDIEGVRSQVCLIVFSF